MPSQVLELSANVDCYELHDSPSSTNEVSSVPSEVLELSANFDCYELHDSPSSTNEVSSVPSEVLELSANVDCYELHDSPSSTNEVSSVPSEILESSANPSCSTDIYELSSANEPTNVPPEVLLESLSLVDSTVYVINSEDMEYMYGMISIGVLNKLNEKKSNTDVLFNTLYQYLRESLFNDDRLISSIYKYLGFRRDRFILRLNRFSNGILSLRGKTRMTLQQKQLIHDAWVGNSQVTVDRRNGRDMVSIPKSKYDKLYSSIETEKLVETTNKRGKPIIKALRCIATISVRDLVKKLKDSGHNFSYGSVINYRPFFIGVATEREKLECLCKVYFNMRLLFDTLMHVVKDGNMQGFKSITAYLTSSKSSKFSPSGYTALDCITGQCIICRGILAPHTYQFADGKVVKYYQFETIKTTRKLKDGSTKESKRTERVEYESSVMECQEKLYAVGKTYLIHRYDVEHDKYIWPKILAKANTCGEVITHRDYSENIQEKPKLEIQSMHFSKKSFTLQCTVIHNSIDPKENIYAYHFSDIMKHDWCHSKCVEVDIVENFLPEQSIIRKKTDNCSTR